MSEQRPTEPAARASDLEIASKEKPPSVAGELVNFLKHNKKWWLTPIIVVLVLVGALLLLAGTAAAPFIYTLF
jgi:hypothetical protein